MIVSIKEMVEELTENYPWSSYVLPKLQQLPVAVV